MKIKQWDGTSPLGNGVPKAPHTFYEFFAGVGLARRGLGPKWRCLWANDNDGSKMKGYVANFGGEHFCAADIGLVGPEQIPSHATMAWASFPCQDLSLAGWRRGMSGKRSGVFWAFWRLMGELDAEGRKPPIMVIENVSGLLHGEDWVGLCEALASLNMNFGAMLLDARHFLPQSRPRVFVVAVDRRIDSAAFASPAPGKEPWYPAALRRAVAALPSEIQPFWRWWRLPAPSPHSVTVGALIDTAAGAGVGFHPPEVTEHLLGMMTDVNLAKVAAAKSTGCTEVGMLYRRTRGGVQRAEVRFDGIAGCLRTPSGGSSRQTVLIVKGESIRSRLLSTREAARLMGAPDHALPGSYNEAYKAMGDGVAVPVVAHLSEHLLIPLAESQHSPHHAPENDWQDAGARRELLKRSHERANEWQMNPDHATGCGR